MARKLTCPAPNRESYSTGNGLFATRRWTEQGVREVLSYGGWFKAGSDFESTKVARIAGQTLLEKAL